MCFDWKLVGRLIFLVSAKFYVSDKRTRRCSFDTPAGLRYFLIGFVFFFISFLRDYSDSGEELSDDDIEIDYDDDDDDDGGDGEDEDVEKVVKPLPPVARTVYKKNDWISLFSHLSTYTVGSRAICKIKSPLKVYRVVEKRFIFFSIVHK